MLMLDYTVTCSECVKEFSSVTVCHSYNSIHLCSPVCKAARKARLQRARRAQKVLPLFASRGLITHGGLKEQVQPKETPCRASGERGRAA